MQLYNSTSLLSCIFESNMQQWRGEPTYFLLLEQVADLE